MKRTRLLRPFLVLSIALALAGFVVAPIPVSAQAPPTFTKSFAPSTIGPGSISTLTFRITNGDPVNPVTDVAFTDNLPAGVAVATPARVISTCDGLLNAPDGGSTISFTQGRLATSSTCTIHVDVTSSSVGTHTNTSEDLTSSAGNSGNATADLIVDPNRPGFSKGFQPDSIPLGAESRLTFLIDNSANGAAVLVSNFSDNLPVGMVVAGPANVTTDCDGGFTSPTITAIPGTGAITFFNGYVAAGAACTLGVDVTTTWAGGFNNTTTELNSQPLSGGGLLSSGRASAILEVRRDFLLKRFTNDPVPPGGSVKLNFTLTNLDRRELATGISFSDDLDAALTGLVGVGLPFNDVCGAGSQLSGTGLLTLTGASLAPESSCSFDVQLQVPAAAAAGIYTNTTSLVNADIGGPTTRPAATAALVVSRLPAFSKHFSPNPVTAGQGVTATFTITNTDPSDAATGIAFTDDLEQFFSGITVSGLPAMDICGPGSLLYVNNSGIPRSLVMIGGSLSSGATCSFDVRFGVPASAPNATYTNTTSYLDTVIGGAPVSGRPASDSLTVAAAPRLRKSFGAGQVLPGDTVDLTFTLAHDQNAQAAATAIAFSDDLDATLPGLVATGLPVQDVCGPGSQLSSIGQLSFTGGSLAPGESCTFTVTLQMPHGALPGSYSNTTGAVSAEMAGLAVTGMPAHALLQVGGLYLQKSFGDGVVLPGGTATLTFSLTNSSPVSTATQIAFSDNLAATLSGLSAVGLPAANVCGAGSQIVGTDLLVFSGGQLPPGTSCAFNVTVQIPASAAPGEYSNQTSGVQATLDGAPVSAVPATDDLIVSDVLALTKSFGEDSVRADSTVALAFSITNAHPVQSATQLTFSDDLDAVLPGLVATGLPANDVCGAGSQISGTSYLAFSGGGLAPSATCVFTVSLQVPAGASPGTFVNRTSQIAGNVGGQPAAGNAATDALTISGVPEAGTLVVDKVTVPTGEPAGFDFMLAGGLLVHDVPFSLTDAGPPERFLVRPSSGYRVSESAPTGWELASAACDNGSAVDDISVSAGETVTCTFTNAGADLAIAKLASPTAVAPGQAVTYTLAFSNTKGVLASGVIVSDVLPVSLTPTRVLSAGAAITRLLPGYAWAVEPLAPGQGGVITISGLLSETMAAQIITNTATITGSNDINVANNCSSAAVAVELLSLQKSFSDDPALPGDTVTLAFSLTNRNSVSTATQIAFSDDLGAVLSGLAAVGPPVQDVCGAGSQIDGTNLLTFSGGRLDPAASCAFSVSLQVPESASSGTFVNRSSQITGNVGGQPTTGRAATDELTIIGAAEAGTIVVDKVTVPAGELAIFSFTLAGGLLQQDVPFSLADAGPPERFLVRPGMGYRVSESVPSSWRLASATCDNGSPVDDISVSAGEIVTCTFTNAGADLAIVKLANPAVAIPGQVITFTLAFSNVRGDLATGVVISDALPAGLTPTRVLSAGVAITRLLPGYVWAVGPLAPGQGGLITISALLSETLAAQVVTNTAIIAGSHDIALGNNQGSATVTVEPLPPVYKFYLQLILKDAVFPFRLDGP